MIKLRKLISERKFGEPLPTLKSEMEKHEIKINESIHRGDNTAYFDSDRYIAIQFPRLGQTWSVKTYDSDWVHADDDDVLNGIAKTMKKCNDEMNKIANKAEREIKSVLKSAERDLTSQEKTWKRKNR